MDASPQPSAQVGGASEDVTQTLIPHKLPPSLLDQTLHLSTHIFVYIMNRNNSMYRLHIVLCCMSINIMLTAKGILYPSN